MIEHPVVGGSVAVLVLAMAGLLAGCAPAEPGRTAVPASGEAPTNPGPIDPTPVAGDPTPVAGETAGPGVVIVALNIAFQPAAVTVAAGAPFALVLDNRDDGIPHNLAVKGQDGSTIAKSEIVTGPARTELLVAPLVAGAYGFTCEVHPNMTGRITVTP